MPSTKCKSVDQHLDELDKFILDNIHSIPRHVHDYLSAWRVSLRANALVCAVVCVDTDNNSELTDFTMCGVFNSLDQATAFIETCEEPSANIDRSFDIFNVQLNNGCKPREDTEEVDA